MASRKKDIGLGDYFLEHRRTGTRPMPAEGEQPRNSAQDAEGLKQWEREQGIDPNQGSGHERRPPSSSKDAAQMEHDRYQGELREYISWLDGMRKNPPWAGKKETATEKVQGVTHPIGEELGEELLKRVLEKGGPYGKALSKGLGGIGTVFDILGNPKDAW